MPEGNARAAHTVWRLPHRVPTEFAEPTRPLPLRTEHALRRMLVTPAVVIDPTGRPPPGPDVRQPPRDTASAVTGRSTV
ncbi:hypothetical protein [Streptomyces sp. x-80]|uniref:hypothetical protein n=1 Tax=Streptomyces sp. x-80 TaxID=2789282 RepID=UPI00397EE238